MKLDSKYYSYCKEIGLMKENYTKERALTALKTAVKEAKAADPKFVEVVNNLTLSSPEVELRVCVLYRYDIDVDYVVGGNIKNTRIYDFGASGCPDGLYITDYKGEGNYTVLQDVSSVPYGIFNDNNLFTYEEMKKSLTNVIDKRLPSGTTSFQSKNWSVSAYFVPVFTIVVNYKGKDYALNYNLHNGGHHWNYPDNPALLKKGKSAKGLGLLAKLGAFVLPIISVISGFDAVSNSVSSAVPTGLVLGIIALIVNFIINKKTKKSKKFYQRYFINNPEKKLLAPIKSSIVMLVIGFIAFIAGFVG